MDCKTEGKIEEVERLLQENLSDREKLEKRLKELKNPSNPVEVVIQRRKEFNIDLKYAVVGEISNGRIQVRIPSNKVYLADTIRDIRAEGYVVDELEVQFTAQNVIITFKKV